jgi:hypothetical protein
LTICILSSKTNKITKYEETYPWTTTLTFVLAVFVDALNTVSLCYYLHKMRSTFKGWIHFYILWVHLLTPVSSAQIILLIKL